MISSVVTANEVVIGYLDHHFGQFRKHLEKARTELDNEAIHQYRVAIKRIRSVFRAVNESYPGKILADELLSPLKNIFKAGGPVRDEHVQLDLVTRFEKENGILLPLIRDHYKRRIENCVDEFMLRSRFFDRDIPENFSASVQAALYPLDKNDLQSRLYAWIDQSMEKLGRKRLRAGDPFKLHQFRTRFKQLLYLAEMVYQSDLTPNLDKPTYQKMKALGQQLGDWHDYFQLWSKAGEFFYTTTNIHLLEESFQLKKLLTPVHDKLFNAMQDKLNQENLFRINFTSGRV